MTHGFSHSALPRSLPANRTWLRLVCAVLACCLAWVGSLAAQPMDDFEPLQLGRGSQTIEGRYFRDRSGMPQGALVIASTERSRRLKLDNLALNLTQHGWSSLVIRLPPTAASHPPARSAPNAMTDTEYLRLAIEFIQTEKGQFNLVLVTAEDSWERLFGGDAASKPPPLQGYILLNIGSASNIGQLPPGAPVLDISTRQISRALLTQRKAEAHRAAIARYQQVRLGSVSAGQARSEDRIGRRIRGWLKTNVQGMQIN